MAPPLFALPFLGKLGAMLGLGGKAAATQLAIPGLAAAAATKAGAAAGTKMAAGAAFKGGLGKAIFGTMSRPEVIGRLAPDAAYGVIAGAMNPGDLGDKLIAGGTQALGGGLGGIALGRAGQAMGVGGTGGFLLDMAGSYGGDVAGMSVGDQLQKAKDKLMGGQGETPYERMGREQQEQYAQQIRQNTISGLGLVPGVREDYGGVDYLSQLGLAG